MQHWICSSTLCMENDTHFFSTSPVHYELMQVYTISIIQLQYITESVYLGLCRCTARGPAYTAD